MNDFLKSGTSGSIGALFVYPIDLVKTRLQNQIKYKQLNYNNNAISCFYHIIKKEGIFGLYRGSLINVTGVFPEKAIKITTFNKFNSLLGESNMVLSGALAGASQVIITNPIEFIKIQMQMQQELNTKNNSIIKILRENNLLKTYKNCFPCLVRDVLFSSIYFPTYNYLKDNNYNYFLSGILSGALSAYTTTPFYIIKTRIQTIINDNLKITNFAYCALKIYRLEGFSYFFRGSVIRTLRTSLQFGFTFYIYEKISKNLE